MKHIRIFITGNRGGVKLSVAQHLEPLELGVAIDALIERLDAAAGDPDLETNGDELNGNGSKEDFKAHFRPVGRDAQLPTAIAAQRTTTPPTGVITMIFPANRKTLRKAATGKRTTPIANRVRIGSIRSMTRPARHVARTSTAFGKPYSIALSATAHTSVGSTSSITCALPRGSGQ